MDRKKKYLCLVILVSIVAVGVYFINKTEKTEYVMQVNKMDVAKEEIIFATKNQQSVVKNSLMYTYNISAEDFNWDSTYGEKKGYEYVIDNVISQVTNTKILQQEAVAASIIDNFNYRIFLDMLEAENDRRKTLLANNETVFGVEQYSDVQYYEYLHNNWYLQVREHLITNKSLTVTNQEIEEEYENNKEYFNNEPLENIKSNVQLLCYDDKMNTYLDDQVKNAKVQYDSQEIEEIIQDILQ